MTLAILPSVGVIILKVAVIAFIVTGIVVLIVRGVRTSRANRSDPNWKGRGQPGHEASIHGAMPNTPLPDWAHWDDQDDEPHR